MLGRERGRDLPRVMGLVEFIVIESDSKSLHRTRRRLGHQTHYDRRVHASAEHGAQRHIADQPHANRFC